MGGIGCIALGVGRGTGHCRQGEMDGLAGEGGRRLQPVDDAAIRDTAQPAIPPAAGHGPSDSPIPGRKRTRKRLAKIALLVLDGLAFDQWLLLREEP